MVNSLPAAALPPVEQASVDRLVVAWQNPVTGGAITPIGLLEKTKHGYAFAYLRRAETLPGFRPLLGLEDLNRRYESPTLFPLFRQRLMDRRRPDYRRYLQVLGLPYDVDPLGEIARSGGRRAGDSLFVLPEPIIDAQGRTSTEFFVHGVRHKAGAEACISTLRLGDRLELLDEPSNPVNQRALVVTHDGDQLGYVPDLLVDYMHTVRATSDLVVKVAQVNGPDAPPNLRLRARVEGFVPTGYRPFHGDAWELAST
jgi:hypothetical protein